MEQQPSNTFLDTDKEEVLSSREEQEFHIDEMKASLRIKQKELQTQARQNDQLRKEVNDNDKEVEKCHEQIARQATVIHEQSQKISQINRDYEDAVTRHRDILKESKLKHSSIQENAKTQDGRIEFMHVELEDQIERNRVLAETCENMKEQNEELMIEVDQKTGEMK